MERSSWIRRTLGLAGAVALAAGLVAGTGCSDGDVAAAPPPGVRLWIDDGPDKPATTIQIAIAETDWYSLTIRDADGGVARVLEEDVLAAGVHAFVWNGRDDDGMPVASGAYWAVVSDGEDLLARAMMLIK